MSDVVAIMAHPDDAEIWAGGTLALHARDSNVTILVASEDPVRTAEAKAGSELLGCGIRVVEHHSYENCVEILSDLRPQIVLTHRLDDIHFDHRQTSELCLRAVTKVAIRTGFPKRLYSCDTYESLTITGLIPGRTLIDISSTFRLKCDAINAHQSQPIEDFVAMATRMAATWGGRAGCEWAEAFDPIPLLGRLPSNSRL